MEKTQKYTAIVVAAGTGSRMQSETRKQFLTLKGMPVYMHALKAFEENGYITGIVLVVPRGHIDSALKECMEQGIRKIKNITEGGDERFRSVYNGLMAAPADTDYVLIHDGVRPLVSQEIIDRCCKFVPIANACVAAVPVTDTIKKADKHGFAVETPDRSRLWSIQTPQAFSFQLIKKAYDSLYKTIENYHSDTSRITDDSIIVENMTDTRVRLFRGDYKNIKITTRYDLLVADALMGGDEGS